MALRNVAAVILAGGQGERLSVLSAQRAKPAVPFAGKYRIIDFTLSNCVNSGIYRVAVLTQYRPHSLNDHIGIGRPWDLDRMRGGVRMLQPYLGRRGSDWYKGTADAVYQNLSSLADWRADTLLILSGDHVYKMDYHSMLAFHDERKADATVAVMQVPMDEAHRFGTLVAADDGSVEHSVLSPGVFVAEGAVVRDSILFTDCIVGPGSVLDHVILDKHVVVGADVRLGDGDDTRPNRTQPRNLQSGITVVGKGARIPTGMRIGRNCLIAADVIERDFQRLLSANGHVGTELASGETVDVA